MGKEHFSILTNAFLILKANYASNQAEIFDLVQEAEFEEHHPQDVIQRSQHVLLSPIDRLNQELSWLPELSTLQINEVKKLLDSGKVTNLLKAIEFFPDLPKANILAHLCGTIPIVETILSRLIQAWDEIDQQSLLQFINTLRQTAGFPQVNQAQLEGAIKLLESSHAHSAALSVWRLDKPGKLMEQLLEVELERSNKSNILAVLVHEYDRMSEPHLVKISDNIDKQIEIARLEPRQLQSSIRRIIKLLQQWDEVNQPVQVFEQQLGHEERRSREIYHKLRSLCICLANEKHEFQLAKRLSEALLHTFPELESVAEGLKVDLETLDGLVKQHKQNFAIK